MSAVEPSAATLRAWQCVPYVLGGRDTSGADCWGIVRLVRQALRGDWLPIFAAVDPENRKEMVTVQTAFCASAWPVVEPMPGALAFAIDGAGRCYHCGIVLLIDGRLMVLESNKAHGVRWMPKRQFERLYGDVRYYDC